MRTLTVADPGTITTPLTESCVSRNNKSHLQLSDHLPKSSEISQFSRDGSSSEPMNNDSPGAPDGSAPVTRLNAVNYGSSVPPSGDVPDGIERNKALTISASTSRLSVSSRSDTSSSHTNLTAQTKRQIPLTPSFSWFSRRKHKAPQNPLSIFDVSHQPQEVTSHHSMESPAASQMSLDESLLRVSRETNGQARITSRSSSSRIDGAIKAASTAIAELSTNMSADPVGVAASAEHDNGTRCSSSFSRLQLRRRSLTIGSPGRYPIEDHLAPETRTSFHSIGRRTLGDVFGFNRLRQTADSGQKMGHGSLSSAPPSSSTSKNSSIQLPREPILPPDRHKDESAVKYLNRVEKLLSRGVIASTLSRGTDPFFSTVLRSYMRRFSFFGDPMDMAIRKLLMEAELPRETQQIDRYLQAFANRYHECNPGIYSSPDQAYFVAFSLLILHTDVFNKNNKHKMQQADYIKNTRGEGVYEPILKCFYDNITYTPFIHVEDDVVWSCDRQRTKRKTMFSGGTSGRTPRKPPKEPLDPYTLILEGKLDTLRPSLKDVMELDDHYTYLGTARDFNVKELQQAFFRTGVLQIVSKRSRPDAFRDENSASNPTTALQGIVDLKVTKVGILWRKEPKNKKTRSRWQEWGAILTGAQLYLFRNTAWVKNLMHQYESHIKQGFYGEPITFKPHLLEFKPDAFMPTKDAVALVDFSYTKHKFAFKYARPAAFVEELLLADNEEEMNDWLAKLNYAATFMTSGIRMRGVVGSHYEGQSRRGIRRLDSSNTAQVIQTPTGEVSIVRGRIDQHEAESILAQRRQAMAKVVEQAARDIKLKERELDEDLRNARHLQILSPVQASSREELLREAARMDVKIKWTRMEIWRIKCCRDVLARDLKEEGFTLEDSSGTKLHQKHKSLKGISSSPNLRQPYTDVISTRAHYGREEQCALSLLPITQSDAVYGHAQNDVSHTGIFQDSAMPATPGVCKHQSSGEPPLHSLRLGSSTDSCLGSGAERTSMIQENCGSGKGNGSQLQTEEDSQFAPETSGAEEHRDNLDACERRAGEHFTLSDTLSLNPDPVLGLQRTRAGSVSAVAEALEQQDLPTGVKQHKSKSRRSLQRTLREGAEPLSHHRSRRDKVSGSNSISKDFALREDMLSRESGSFVVQGRKASVIDLGNGLQRIAPEAHVKQRVQLDHAMLAINKNESSNEVDGRLPDVQAHTESFTSTSKATTKSFQELHRKYSSTQASRTLRPYHKPPLSSHTKCDAAIGIAKNQRMLPVAHTTQDGHELGLLPGLRKLSPGSDSTADGVQLEP